MIFSKFFKNNKKSKKGFTLIELLVVIAIISIMASISFFNYDSFGKNIELNNDTYLVALRIREAQIFGINRKSSDVSSEKFNFGDDYTYGLYFNIDTTNPVVNIDKTKFITYIDGLVAGSKDNQFTDKGADNCTNPAKTECISTLILNRGNIISNIYVEKTGTWSEAKSLDIEFKRPNPDAIIKVNNDNKSRARIILQDKTGTYKGCIEIGSAGDISIKSENDCQIS